MRLRQYHEQTQITKLTKLPKEHAKVIMIFLNDKHFSKSDKQITLEEKLNRNENLGKLYNI